MANNRYCNRHDNCQCTGYDVCDRLQLYRRYLMLNMDLLFHIDDCFGVCPIDLAVNHYSYM